MMEELPTIFSHPDVIPAVPSINVKSSLYPHQARALAWMMDRENSTICKGGIIMDEAGLGKTIQMLSLVMTKRCNGPTLIICPTNLIDVWINEAQRHLRDFTYKILVYHGSERKLVSPSEFIHFDIVLTTYDLMNRDMPTLMSTTVSNIHSYQWGRIILDEAHYIRNANTVTSRSIKLLKAPLKWALTATAVFNKLDDLYPLLDFIQLPPFAGDANVWYRQIVLHVKHNARDGKEKLYNYMTPICLRRTKAILDLPPLTYIDINVEFSDTEQEFYDSLFDYSRLRVAQHLALIEELMHKKKHTRREDRIKGDRRIKRCTTMILQLIMRLRQCCSNLELPTAHMERIKRLAMSNSSPVANIIDKHIEALHYVTDRLSTDDCELCLDKDREVKVSPCGHCVCNDCYERQNSKTEPIMYSYPMCPVCMARIGNTTVIPTASLMQYPHTDEFPPSPKIRRMIAMMMDEPNEKVVIASQWISVLDKVEKYITAEFPAVKICRLQGSVPPHKRSSLIELFQTSEDHRVCLLSSQCSSEGINLTSSARVYILDQWWNESRDYQISNRIHRIGQKRPAKIIRFKNIGTIEDKLEIMRTKKTAILRMVSGEGVDETNMEWCNSVRLVFNLGVRTETGRRRIVTKNDIITDRKARSTRRLFKCFSIDASFSS
jgi:SNF2 family DNA or RNA helicase